MLELKARWKSRGGLVPMLAMIVVAGLLSGGVAWAVGLRPAHETFEISQLGEATGQHSPITAIVQSRDGYVWLGTYHGLVRFDGVRSVVFDSSNTRGLQNGAITSLLEGPDGALWIGHETGQLTRFAHGVF